MTLVKFWDRLGSIVDKHTYIYLYVHTLTHMNGYTATVF